MNLNLKRASSRAAGRTLLGLVLAASSGAMLVSAATAVDPGVRPFKQASQMIPGMTANQIAEFPGYKNVFFEINNNAQNPIGLGPSYSSDGCNVCHIQPAMGGSSPAANPLFQQYQLNGATNTMPAFVTPTSPIVNARSPFKADGVTPDGHVQPLFVTTGRSDAAGCNATQPDFAGEAAAGNLIFRQTTPIFGEGLMEIIQNSDILANMQANAAKKQSLGITGHPNLADDGTIMRFGWKAQGRSLIIFGGDAYNIEEGITNEISPSELNLTPGCSTNSYPEDHTNFAVKFVAHDFMGDLEDLGNFPRFLAPPPPVAKPTASQLNGKVQFTNAGCVLCHTTSFTTPKSPIAALSNIQTNLYSDILVHHMGSCHADNIVQGDAGGDEFRTAPLWGVGQRVFFMHEGATKDIVQAVEMHSCAASAQYPASEANAVVNAFNALSAKNQQDLVNFLRSL